MHARKVEEKRKVLEKNRGARGKEFSPEVSLAIERKNCCFHMICVEHGEVGSALPFKHFFLRSP